MCPDVKTTYKAGSLAIIQFHPFLSETPKGLML